MRLYAWQGDITTVPDDAIVNAANRELMGGGGVDGAIHQAAGWDDLQRACRELGGCDVGDAKATPGFALPAKWIIHTVGPVWAGGGRRDERSQLASCYRRSIEVADSLGARSVAFPAISTGVFRFPPEIAADTAVSTLRSLTTNVEAVRLVAFDLDTFLVYEGLL